MIDITHKSVTLRQAIATAVVRVSDPATLKAVRDRTVPKGDVLEAARVAGLFAVKKTSEMIPDCHPLPVEYAAIRYEIGEMELHIAVEVHTVYKTGVEVEAMHGASVVALTVYDMLKPIDKGVEIQHIRLQEKKGGKSDKKLRLPDAFSAAVIVCSDTIAAGKKEDKAGKVIREKLQSFGIAAIDYRVIPDDQQRIQQAVQHLCAARTDLIIFTGGTGLSPRDFTPEAVRPLLDREIPGIMEQARRYGQDRMPYAMLSRGIAGTIGDTVVLTFPGSTRGAAESMDAVFPQVLHIFTVRTGARHDETPG
jgi:cyclic pyranopterin phosphate synthase